MLYTAQELALALSSHWELKFPPLNYAPVLIQHIKDLTLPLDIYLMVKCLAHILGTAFDYPDGTIKQVRLIDSPEVLLITLVVVATKLLHPLDDIERPPAPEHGFMVKQINWKEWRVARETRPPSEREGLKRGTEHEITSNDALSMDEKKMDDFMNWFETMWIANSEKAKSRCPSHTLLLWLSQPLHQSCHTSTAFLYLVTDRNSPCHHTRPVQ